MTGSSSRGQTSGEMEPSLAHREPRSGRHHGVSEGGQGALTLQTHATPPPAASRRPSPQLRGSQHTFLSHSGLAVADTVTRSQRYEV